VSLLAYSYGIKLLLKGLEIFFKISFNFVGGESTSHQLLAEATRLISAKTIYKSMRFSLVITSKKM